MTFRLIPVFFSTLSDSKHSLNSDQVSNFLFYLRSPCFSWSSSSSSSVYFEVQRPFQNLIVIFLKTCPYHHTPIAHACLSTVSCKSNIPISSSVLIRSIRLTPHIALTILLSVLLKIAISFSLKHHISLPYNTLENVFLYLQWKASPTLQLTTFSKFHPSKLLPLLSLLPHIPKRHLPNPQITEPFYIFNPMT